MKRDHRVPLCRRAVEILNAARTLGDGGPLVFTTGGGRPLSVKRLRRLLELCGITCVPHGFRSSFRDWAAEETDHPREVVEAALAHVVLNRVEAAYARSDLFERRRRLMNDWAAYLAGVHRRQPTTRADGEQAQRLAPLRCRSTGASGADWRGIQPCAARTASVAPGMESTNSKSSALSVS